MALCEPHITTPSAIHNGWQGYMQFTARQGRTQLQRTERVGPLSVQRAFYPEANGTAHLYLLHPPAGIVSGDELYQRKTGRQQSGPVNHAGS